MRLPSSKECSHWWVMWEMARFSGFLDGGGGRSSVGITRKEMVRMPPVFQEVLAGGRCECWDLPEAKAAERMAVAWASLRLRVSDMVVECLDTRHGFETWYQLYTLHDHSTPSGISAMSSSIISQLKSTNDNGLSGRSLDDPEDNDSTAYDDEEDSLALQTP